MTKEDIIKEMQEKHGYNYVKMDSGLGAATHKFVKHDSRNLCTIEIEDHTDEDDDPDYYIYSSFEMLDLNLNGISDRYPYCITHSEMKLINEFIDILKGESRDTKNDDLIIVTAPHYLKTEAMGKLHRYILNQRETGVIVIPSWIKSYNGA